MTTPGASVVFAASVWDAGEPGVLDGHTPAGGAATAIGARSSVTGWWQWADVAYSAAASPSAAASGMPDWSAPRVPVPAASAGSTSATTNTSTSAAWRPSTQTTPHATALSVEERHLTQILQTFSDNLGGPREDTGTERIAGFSSRMPREERYYGHDARGSNRSVTDERGRVAGTQSFDPWGVPYPGKRAGPGAAAHPCRG